MKYVKFLNYYEYRMKSFGWSVDECTELSGVIDKRAEKPLIIGLENTLGISHEYIK